jgi:hypothetical protein
MCRLNRTIPAHLNDQILRQLSAQFRQFARFNLAVHKFDRFLPGVNHDGIGTEADAVKCQMEQNPYHTSLNKKSLLIAGNSRMGVYYIANRIY